MMDSLKNKEQNKKHLVAAFDGFIEHHNFNLEKIKSEVFHVKHKVMIHNVPPPTQLNTTMH